MTRRRADNRGATLDPADFPALAAFARGYLHQEYVQEHGSPAVACEAYCADASPDERDALTADLSRLVALSPGPTPRTLRRFFLQGLGAAWAPGTRDDLEHLANTTRRLSSC